MATIALNARFYAHRPTGMQRYALQLSQRFGPHLDALVPRRALRGPAGHLWEQLYLPSVVRGRLLWSPNNTGPLAVSRQVCTIHDLIPIDHPEWFSQGFSNWYAWLMPALARRVWHIIAISEFTKQRILERLGVPEEKITVIPNGVDERFHPQSAESIETVRRELGIDGRPYVLCVGSVEPRKNLPRLLEAWRRAQSSIPKDVYLVAAGAHGNSRVFLPVSLPAVSPRVHFAGYVSDDCLPPLYAGALAVVYPSLYEGFGLPPLEAMACGTSVVTSAGTSLGEVVGDNAVLVDPEDVDSIAEGIVCIVSSESLRKRLGQTGRERATQFTWDATAKRTLKVLLEQAASRN
jgi:glycosyltransferase involved in cell wall biosynthesis